MGDPSGDGYVFYLDESMSVPGHESAPQRRQVLHCGKLGKGYLGSVLSLRPACESMVTST